MSLNPSSRKNVSTKDFERAIEKVETKLGIASQPRAIVFHEKDGRRHCHAVWSQIDANSMRAIPLSFSKLKLMEVSKESYLQHGWNMSPGMMNSQNRDPRSFSLAEWQQAKRARMVEKQAQERKALAAQQDQQRKVALSNRQARFRTGLRGLMDRVTGNHSRIKKRNEREANEELRRDQNERDHLIFNQMKPRRHLQSKIERLKGFTQHQHRAISQDISQYWEIEARRRENAELRSKRETHHKRNGPKLEM